MNFDIKTEQVSQTMTRLSHKIQLLYDTTEMWKTIAQNRACYPKKYYMAYVKSILKDTKQGLREIDKKNGVYVEMPKLESVGNGQVKKVYADNATRDDEVEVSAPIIAQTTVVPYKTDEQ